MDNIGRHELGDNLLPYDGEAYYVERFLDGNQSNSYYITLFDAIPWQSDQLVMFGKKIVTKRKVAWYGDRPFRYTYAQVDKYAVAWTATLLAIKCLIETHTQNTYNSCLLNLYHNGQEGMGWHADNEPELLHHGSIASVSLGATRKFVLKHRNTKLKIELYLEQGSLLLMQGTIQDHWLHRLTTTTQVHSPRINLTFRTIESDENPRK